MKGYVLETCPCPELVVKTERKTVLWRTQYAETWESQSSDVREEGYKAVKEGKTKRGEEHGRRTHQ